MVPEGSLSKERSWFEMERAEAEASKGKDGEGRGGGEVVHGREVKGGSPGR